MFADIHPVMLLHRVRSDSSVVFVRVPVSDIEFPEFRRREDLVSGVEITFFIVDSVNSTSFRDSGRFVFKQLSKPATSYLQMKIGFRHHVDSAKFVELRIRDIISGAETAEVLPIFPDGRMNMQRYYIYYNDLAYPFARNYIRKLDSCRIFTSLPADSLWTFHLTLNTKDSIPFDTVYRSGLKQFLKFSDYGTNVMNVDSLHDGGMRVLIVDNCFPMIKSAEQMLPPLRMLTNSDEWSLLLGLNAKQAVDTFWLKSAPNAETAKQQIQIFYNRLQLANMKFSGQREGWQTPPGKILTLAGLPDEVEMTDVGQNWYYYIGKREKLKIPFIQNFLTNEFELGRNDSILNGFLLHHINSWRNGSF